jgi:hypothetical protein
MERIVSLPKYKTRGDFALVLQPFLRNARVPKLPNGQPDISYFAPDCIHFSGTHRPSRAMLTHSHACTHARAHSSL